MSGTSVGGFGGHRHVACCVCFACCVCVYVVREHEYCATQGICDFNTGLCDCRGPAECVACCCHRLLLARPAFSRLVLARLPATSCRGPACDQLTFQVIVTDDPELHLFTQKPDYRGNILLIEATREESDEFNFIMATANFNELFKVTGEGLVRGSRNSHNTRNGRTVPLRFVFGGLSCVPALMCVWFFFLFSFLMGDSLWLGTSSSSRKRKRRLWLSPAGRPSTAGLSFPMKRSPSPTAA